MITPLKVSTRLNREEKRIGGVTGATPEIMQNAQCFRIRRCTRAGRVGSEISSTCRCERAITLRHERGPEDRWRPRPARKVLARFTLADRPDDEPTAVLTI